MTPHPPGEGHSHSTGASDLKGRSVRGGAATIGAQVVRFAMDVASTAILTRLLAPSDFGLVAMAAAAGSFVGLFLDLGLDSATVQRVELTRTQASTLFWINAVLGLCLAVILVGLAPLVAQFYGEPRLVGVTRALALGFVISGLSIQPGALMRRQMRFTTLAAIGLVSRAFGIATAATTASLGAGYWALVWMALAQRIASAAGIWMVCGWTPGPPGSLREVRPFFAVGAGFAGFRILNYLVRNLDNIIIGRVVGTAALGLYLKSYSLLLVPVGRVREPVSSIIVPALSRLQGDPARFRRFFLRAIASVASAGMPAVVFLFVFADDAVSLVLGPQWQESVLLFRALAPAAFLETFNTVGSWACTPFGRSERLLKWQLFATPVSVVAFLIGAHWGALGVAASFSVSSVVLRIPALVYLLKGSPISPLDLVAPLARPAAASLGAGALIVALRWGLSTTLSGALLLVIAGPVFGALYLGSWFVMPGGRRTLGEFKALLAELSPKGAR